MVRILEYIYTSLAIVNDKQKILLQYQFRKMTDYTIETLNVCEVDEKVAEFAGVNKE